MSISNLNHYVFKQKKSFLQNPTSGTGYASFLGEVYEAYFYEVLLELVQAENLDWRLAIKGPYAHHDGHYVRTGFHCSGDGKCIYNIDGVAFAEFDCLAIGSDTVYFYECSISNKCNVAIKWEMLKKKILLDYLFPKHKIVPVVVSVHKEVVAYCQRWQNEGLEAWHVPMPQLDWLTLASDNHPKTLPKPSQVMGLQELNYMTESVPYFDQLLQLTQVLAQGVSVLDVHNHCSGVKRHLFSRLYWGTVSGVDSGVSAANLWDQVIVVVDVSKAANPILRYYVHRENDKRFFEFTPDLEPVKRIKFSRLELVRVLPFLQVKTAVDLQNLQQDVKQWRQLYLAENNVFMQASQDGVKVTSL